MTLKEKFKLLKEVLVKSEDYSDLVLKNVALSGEIDDLNATIKSLSTDNEKLKAENEAFKGIQSQTVDKVKNSRVPSKIVIAKYSLYINKDRTHIAAFTKSEVLLSTKGSYSSVGYDIGYVLDGLTDKNLRAILNEYGELFPYACDSKNTQYTSNVVIYDYLTLPQILSMMDIPVDINQKGVPVEVINAAVKYAMACDSELFNSNVPKKRMLFKPYK